VEESKELRNAIREIYREDVQDLISAGSADKPDWVVKMVLKGKAVTSSELDGFTDAVQCYYVVIDQEFRPKTPGPTSPGTIVANPTIIYVPYNAILQTYGPFIKGDIFEEIEVVRLFTANDTTQPSVGFSMKSARLCRAPTVFSTKCLALAFSYSKFSYTSFSFDEAGKKTGTREQVSYDFETNKAG